VVLDLDVDLQAVVASCTCPHYDDGNLCKHIWASLEAAEAEGQLSQIAEMDHATILTEIEYSEDDDEFDQLGELDEEDDDFGYRRSTDACASLGISRSVQLLPVLLLTRTGFRSTPASVISRRSRSAGIHAVRNGAIFLKALPAAGRAVASPVGRCFDMVFQG